MSVLAVPRLDGPVARRHALTASGRPDGQAVLFGHGFGTDQSMWRAVASSLEDEHRVLLFDLAGAGRSDSSAYSRRRHGTLHGYAEDLVELLVELGLGPVAFVGHSASAMIGVLAAVERPELFASLTLVGGSPRYVDEPASGYVGGFQRADVDGLLASIEANYLAWSQAMAPVVMGNADRPELSAGLAASFARAEGRTAAEFARAIFLSDHRDVLPRVRPPVLVVQPAEDPMVPEAVAHYLHAHLPTSTLQLLEATGHFPHVSGVQETAQALRRFLRSG